MRFEIRDDAEPTAMFYAVQRQMERMLASKVFANAARLSKFLRFGVESALSGAKTVNEYSIGVDVFERDVNFDPRVDPIVRVHARRLRSKLAEYYATEGADDPIEIQLPLRRYIPVFRQREPDAMRPKSAFPIPPASRGKPSIAVFRFLNLTPDRNGDYFAEGLTREVVHSLADCNDWRVVSCASDHHRPDGHGSPPQLNVQASVSGTIRKAEKRIRVSAELLSVPDGTVLWSHMYEVEPEGVISTQENIARSICEAVGRRLGHSTDLSFNATNRGAD
jgi:serine/threonine-protein kinase